VAKHVKNFNYAASCRNRKETKINNNRKTKRAVFVSMNSLYEAKKEKDINYLSILTVYALRN